MPKIIATRPRMTDDGAAIERREFSTMAECGRGLGLPYCVIVNACRFGWHTKQGRWLIRKCT